MVSVLAQRAASEGPRWTRARWETARPPNTDGKIGIKGHIRCARTRKAMKKYDVPIFRSFQAYTFSVLITSTRAAAQGQEITRRVSTSSSIANTLLYFLEIDLPSGNF